MSSSDQTAPQQKVAPKRPDIFNGPILSTTIKLSIPILISQILAFAYIIVDTIFISAIDRSSTALISGAGLVYPVYLVFFTLSRGVFMGMSSVTARGVGQKNEELLKRVGDSGLLLTLAMIVVALIVSVLFGDPILHFLAGSNLSDKAIGYGIDYFYYMLPCMVLLLLFNTYGGILQGEGKAKQFGIASIVSTVLNIILNPIFIFGFDMGIKGSGLASSVSTAIAVLYFVILFARKRLVPITWKLTNASRKLMREVLKIGLPASIGLLLINISALVLNNLVGSIGETEMNAWVLVSRTDQLFVIPAYAVGLTTVPMIGQNYGRGLLERSKRIFQVNLALCLSVSLILGILYALFAPEIFSWFSSVQPVVDASAAQVRYLFAATVALSGITVIGCCFQATGKPLPSLMNNILRAALSCVPLLLPLFNFKIDEMSPIYWWTGIANLLTFAIAFVWASRHFRKLQVKKIQMGAKSTHA